MRLHIDLCKSRGIWDVRARDVAVILGLKESVVHQCFAVLTKEKTLTARHPKRPFALGHAGSYSIRGRPAYAAWGLEFQAAGEPNRKRRVKWAKKRALLAVIRKSKPWVIEQWYEEDQRWWMYMEVRFPTQHPASTQSVFVAPEDQPDLKRTDIAQNHYVLDDVLPRIAELRNKNPNTRYRARDTSRGDYIMGDILL